MEIFTSTETIVSSFPDQYLSASYLCLEEPYDDYRSTECFWINMIQPFHWGTGGGELSRVKKAF